MQILGHTFKILADLGALFGPSGAVIALLGNARDLLIDIFSRAKKNKNGSYWIEPGPCTTRGTPISRRCTLQAVLRKFSAPMLSAGG